MMVPGSDLDRSSRTNADVLKTRDLKQRERLPQAVSVGSLGHQPWPNPLPLLAECCDGSQRGSSLKMESLKKAGHTVFICHALNLKVPSSGRTSLALVLPAFGYQESLFF